jgi:hypothetical protein
MLFLAQRQWSEALPDGSFAYSILMTSFIIKQINYKENEKII